MQVFGLHGNSITPLGVIYQSRNTNICETTFLKAFKGVFKTCVALKPYLCKLAQADKRLSFSGSQGASPNPVCAKDTAFCEPGMTEAKSNSQAMEMLIKNMCSSLYIASLWEEVIELVIRGGTLTDHPRIVNVGLQNLYPYFLLIYHWCCISYMLSFQPYFQDYLQNIR